MEILFLSRWFPYPPDNGSRLRIYHLLKHLSARFAVDLVTFATEPVEEAQRSSLLEFCRSVTVLPYRPFQPSGFKAITGFFYRWPRSVLDTYNPAFQKAARSAWEQHQHGLVIASQVDMALYALRLPARARLLEEVELTTLYEQHQASDSPMHQLRYQLMWQKWQAYTRWLLAQFDGCTAVSELEGRRVNEAAPNSRARLAVIPNGVDLSGCPESYGERQPGRLVFSGALSYSPNLDAMTYFLECIYPTVRAEFPSAELVITGKVDQSVIEKLPHTDGVSFSGYLEDVRPVVGTAWASVVPLRQGGGTRLKILEALGLGTPVITTSKGAEGLDLLAGQELLIADDPGKFADAVVRVLKDASLRQQLGQNGRQAVAARYDWSLIGPQFCDFVERIALKK